MHPPALPNIPGGWRTHTIEIGSRNLNLSVPAAMEHLLATGNSGDRLPYWSHLWPAAEETARALSHAPWSPGASVLELGSGVGLVGLAALARGDRVCFSDLADDALVTCRANATQNGFREFKVQKLDWRDPPASHWPVVIACDVLYEPTLHGPLLNCLNQVLSPDGVVWIGDPGRVASIDGFQQLCERFDVRILTGDGRETLLPSSSRFQIFELRRKSSGGGTQRHNSH